MSTIYELSYAGNATATVVRYFDANENNDMIVRFSEAVLQLDQDEKQWAAWANLKRLPDICHPEGLHIVGWTKISNERPTSEGRAAP